jgi:hypothetical protein
MSRVMGICLVGLLVLASGNVNATESASISDISESAGASRWDGTWKAEMDLQFLSRYSEILPMIGPAFSFRTPSMNEYGFRSLFSTSGRADTGAAPSGPDFRSGTYTGQAFARIAFTDQPTHLYFEPGLGINVIGSEIGLSSELVMGFESQILETASLGAATGFDLSVGKVETNFAGANLAPKLAFTF